MQPFKPHLNLVLCINPTHKVSGTSQTIHSHSSVFSPNVFTQCSTNSCMWTMFSTGMCYFTTFKIISLLEMRARSRQVSWQVSHKILHNQPRRCTTTKQYECFPLSSPSATIKTHVCVQILRSPAFASGAHFFVCPAAKPIMTVQIFQANILSIVAEGVAYPRGIFFWVISSSPNKDGQICQLHIHMFSLFLSLPLSLFLPLSLLRNRWRTHDPWKSGNQFCSVDPRGQRQREREREIEQRERSTRPKESEKEKWRRESRPITR